MCKRLVGQTHTLTTDEDAEEVIPNAKPEPFPRLAHLCHVGVGGSARSKRRRLTP